MGKSIKFIPKGRELDKFLSEQRDKNLSILMQMGLSQDNAEDIYQDSSIALYKNILEEKLTKLTASLTSYFTQICRNQGLKYIRDNKKISTEDDIEKYRSDDEDDGNYDDDRINEVLDLINEEEPWDNLVKRIEPLVKNLPEPCNTLLWGKFWDRLSNIELAGIMKYKSTDSAKTMVSKCLKKFYLTIEPLCNFSIYGNKKKSNKHK